MYTVYPTNTAIEYPRFWLMHVSTRFAVFWLFLTVPAEDACFNKLPAPSVTPARCFLWCLAVEDLYSIRNNINAMGDPLSKVGTVGDTGGIQFWNWICQHEVNPGDYSDRNTVIIWFVLICQLSQDRQSWTNVCGLTYLGEESHKSSFPTELRGSLPLNNH